MPKYSFMVPVYNKEPYLEKCLQSLLKQTYNDYEIILVDDASTDNSYALALELGKKHNNIKVYKNKHNLGIGQTRNSLLSLATGKYLIFIDPDDYVEEKLLEEIDKNLNIDIDIIRFQNVIEPITEAAKVKEKGKDKYRYSIPGTGIISGEIALLSWMMGPRQINTFPWTYCIKSSIYDGVQYPNTKNLEDFPITPYLLAKAKTILSIPFVGYHYCRYDNTLSSISEDIDAKIEKLKVFKEIIRITHKNIYSTSISEKAKTTYMTDVQNRYNIRKLKLDSSISKN